MLSINDQFAPAAAFLGSATVDANPAHVTYVVDTARDGPNYGIVGDHAYWVSGLTIRSQSHTATNGDPDGEIDVSDHGHPARLQPHRSGGLSVSWGLASLGVRGAGQPHPDTAG